jgi:hypothetical protein
MTAKHSAARRRLRADGAALVVWRNIGGGLLGAAIAGGAWPGPGVVDLIPNPTPP